MERMAEQPTYRGYLAQVRKQQDEDRARFSGESGAGGPAYDMRSGHPLNPPLPPTGNAAYDRLEPRRQVHSPAAIAGAGFDLPALERYRRALDANPYGPQMHRAKADGTFEPVMDDEPTD
jgi:hypothetical protein